MAVEQKIFIAAGFNDSGKLEIISEKESFPSASTSINQLDINLSDINWFNYVFCGAKAIEELFSRPLSRGLNLYVSGNIPMGSGLSSSSALVVCSALCFLQSEGLVAKTTRTELANACARAERHIGTQGGGMDQSICLLAESGEAKRIDFNPLAATKVQLPEKAAFVIAHSCTKKEKALSNDFNRRVVECRIAALALQKYKTGKLDLDNIPKLKEIQNMYNGTLEQMVHQLDFAFACPKGSRKPNDILSRAQVLELLDISEEEFATKILSPNTQQVQEFNVFKRADHVYLEALRVVQFENICSTGGNNTLEKLGILMDGSHWSCSKGYECSSVELDELTNVCREGGAYGSRLTGAGWGGCCVSLVDADNVDEFMEKVKKNFYSKTADRSSRLPEAIFASVPSAGAGIFDKNHNQLF
ncbi:Oidioi.mRNA.OKI2018_I69.XSR.g16085.t1.cds [Oikopleura dioica]|uniref:Oidioi.mRNA.OKI2018_I69.XSR.g16085.t1.cds n=1 Tax=Oikopleura dioica TaxID=34765 RepID=A0ABN7SJ77_OIKDI|nr:Oidioi.mRNA.OKI2018_I69.XSR.g16085.t1.cds [Oikopleura dioica]